jgi:hypothetical protein
MNNLTLLERFTVEFFPSILFRDNILDEIQFDGLKYLGLCDSGFLSPPMLSLISTRLPALESLEIRRSLSEEEEEEEDISGRQILHVLKNNNFCFRHSLKSLKLKFFPDLNKEILESIIFDVVLSEKFPIISGIVLPYHGVGSLTSIQSRILGRRR